MKKKCNYTVVIQAGDGTPKFIHRNTQRIMNWNGTHQRSLETKDFIFFVNFQEGDMNGNTIMYRKKDMSLVSDNYFAGEYLFELMTERQGEFTYLSKSAKYNLRMIREEQERNKND